MRRHGRPRSLSPGIVEAARTMRAAGRSIRDIAAALAVPRSTLANAVAGPTAREHADLLARLTRYGMTEVDYDALLVAQGGCCAICRERQAFVVDHDHVTGAVRGLLCNRCNTGLGHLGDSPILLLRGIEYLLAASRATLGCGPAPTRPDVHNGPGP